MGWTVINENESPRTSAEERNFLIRELGYSKVDTGEYAKVVAATKVGSAWFMAVEYSDLDEKVASIYDVDTGPITMGIVVITSRKNGEFGFKIIDENAGPFNTNAPARIINKLSPLTAGGKAAEWAARWRDDCRKIEAAKRREKAWHVGDKIKLKSPVIFSGSGYDSFVVSSYTTAGGNQRRCYYAEGVGLVRLKPEHLIAAEIHP